jgi:hypothetical protein
MFGFIFLFAKPPFVALESASTCAFAGAEDLLGSGCKKDSMTGFSPASADHFTLFRVQKKHGPQHDRLLN